MLLMDLLDLYIKKRLRGRSQRTIVLYKHSINAFGRTLGKEPTTEDLTDENLENHMWKVVKDGKSVATANKDYFQISAIWRFAHRNRLVEVWPNVRTIPEPERVPLGWLPEDIEKLFASIAREEGTIARAPASLWWKCLFNVLLDTGERVGAILKLTRNDLHPQHIHVKAEFRKGKTRDKLFKLSDSTMQEVRLLLNHHSEQNIFPWDRFESYIYAKLSKILQRAGLPDNPKSKFHCIRRTVASAVAQQGGDATAALDHASPKTTKKYLDPRIVGEVPTADLVSQWRLAAKPVQDNPRTANQFDQDK